MSDTQAFLYDSFQSYYKKGLDAKERGDIPEAKKQLRIAAETLSRLAALSDDNFKKIRQERAERILKIVKDMEGARETPQPAPGGVNLDGIDPGVAAYFTFIDPASNKTTFENDVVGLEEARAAITRYLINPTLNAEHYERYDIKRNCTLLLDGPPGTGKTTFARAVANEIRLPFAIINVASLVNCYVGETGKTIDKLFTALRDYSKKMDSQVIVFFDEFDEISKQRGSDDKTAEMAVPALLRNLDGVLGGNDQLVILASTNLKNSLDKGILSRFMQKINIPLPSRESRRMQFMKKLRYIDAADTARLDFDELAELSEGLSGRDIAHITNDFQFILAERDAGVTEPGDLQSTMEELIAIKKKQNED